MATRYPLRIIPSGIGGRTGLGGWFCGAALGREKKKKKKITAEAQSRRDAFGKTQRLKEEEEEEEDYHRDTVPKGCLRQDTEVERRRRRRIF
jgi:hypothetical protein